MQRISPQNMECVALSVQKLRRAGVPNLKGRSRDPDHTHFRGNLSSDGKYSLCWICLPNMKFLA